MEDVAIIGVGLHPFGRFGDKSAIERAADAVRSAFPRYTFHVDCNAAYTPADTELFRQLDYKSGWYGSRIVKAEPKQAAAPKAKAWSAAATTVTAEK